PRRRGAGEGRATARLGSNRGPSSAAFSCRQPAHRGSPAGALSSVRLVFCPFREVGRALRRDAVPLVGPVTEIQQLALAAAERPPRLVLGPRYDLLAGRTVNLLDGIHRQAPRIPDKAGRPGP